MGWIIPGELVRFIWSFGSYSCHEIADAFARIALVASQLEKLNWQSRIEIKSLDGEIYYTYREEGSHFPIADLEDKIPRKIGSLEDDIEEITDRLNNIEYRINQEEIGW